MPYLPHGQVSVVRVLFSLIWCQAWKTQNYTRGFKAGALMEYRKSGSQQAIGVSTFTCWYPWKGCNDLIFNPKEWILAEVIRGWQTGSIGIFPSNLPCSSPTIYRASSPHPQLI